MLIPRIFWLLTCCILAMHTSLIFADEAVHEPTTEQLNAHPEVQGALKAIDAWLEEAGIYERIPSISAGIVHDQHLVWNNGYGYSNVATKEPIEVDWVNASIAADPVEIATAQGEHKALRMSIIERDAETAASIMSAHIDNAREGLEKMLKARADMRSVVLSAQ